MHALTTRKTTKILPCARSVDFMKIQLAAASPLFAHLDTTQNPYQMFVYLFIYYIGRCDILECIWRSDVIGEICKTKPDKITDRNARRLIANIFRICMRDFVWTIVPSISDNINCHAIAFSLHSLRSFSCGDSIDFTRTLIDECGDEWYAER